MRQATPSPDRTRWARRWLPVLVVVAVVGGVASSGGAQVDPVFPTPRSLWATSCVPGGAAEVVAYGRGWGGGGGTVAVEVTDQTGASVGSASVPTVDRPGGGAFQARFGLSVPAGASTLTLVASQGGATQEQTLVVSGSCAPTITAAAGGPPCALAGRPVTVNLTVRGAAPTAFDLVLHHADLHGPAEAVSRTQPTRPLGEYALFLTVPNVPDRVVPVAVEARRPNGSFAFATTSVKLPPACSPNSTTPTSPTTVPGTTQPTSAATTAATTRSPTTAPPFTLPRQPGGGLVSLNLSPAIGRAGEATTVVGRGFPPSSAVTLRWRPGIGEWTVTAGGDGTFRTQVLVLPNDVEGPRVLEVASGGTAPAPYLVVPASSQPAFGGVFL